MAGQKRAAVYCRISDDRRGTEAGVSRQREDGLALVEREGWTLVHDGDTDTFTDNDISAFSGKPRPAYNRLVEVLRANQVDVVVAWHPDRLHRSVRELEDWIDLQEATRTKVTTVKAGQWDLSTSAGRTTARIIGAVSRGESEQKAERVRRAMQQRAEQGKVHGALRTYGYSGRRDDDGRGHTLEVVPEEAEVIREAARRVLSGEALLSVVRDLNARGVPTIRGAQWSRTSLRSILISARVAGWREHTPGRGVNHRQADGTGGLWRGGEFVAQAEWPAILTRSEVERLRRKLTDPSRSRTGSARTYLLSGGLAVCGLCGTAMRGRPNRGTRSYHCPPAPVGLGCGRVSVNADALEEAVIFGVREALRDGSLGEELAARAEGSGAEKAWATAAALREDLESLSADFGAGRISRAEWMAAREPLTARLAAAEGDLGRRQEQESAALLAGGLPEWDRNWAAAQQAGLLDQQRALLRAALTAVKVGPARVRGLNRFDPERFTCLWRV
jgi:site-specific DNA recombinase